MHLILPEIWQRSKSAVRFVKTFTYGGIGPAIGISHSDNVICMLRIQPTHPTSVILTDVKRNKRSLKNSPPRSSGISSSHHFDCKNL